MQPQARKQQPAISLTTRSLSCGAACAVASAISQQRIHCILARHIVPASRAVFALQARVQQACAVHSAGRFAAHQDNLPCGISGATLPRGSDK